MELNEYRVIPTVILPMIPLWILPQPKIDLFLLEARQDTDQELLEAELTKQYIGIKYDSMFKYLLMHLRIHRMVRWE